MIITRIFEFDTTHGEQLIKFSNILLTSIEKKYFDIGIHITL